MVLIQYSYNFLPVKISHPIALADSGFNYTFAALRKKPVDIWYRRSVIKTLVENESSFKEKVAPLLNQGTRCSARLKQSYSGTVII